jgi:hypothetical protein
MLKLNNIYSDNRGAIYSLDGDLSGLAEVTIFETFENYARGGCIHTQSPEHICVLVGEIVFVYGEDRKEVVLMQGECFTIPPMTPHYYFSRTRSVVEEWGPSMEEKGNRHFEFRSIVDQINRGTSK